MLVRHSQEDPHTVRGLGPLGEACVLIRHFACRNQQKKPNTRPIQETMSSSSEPMIQMMIQAMSLKNMGQRPELMVRKERHRVFGSRLRRR